MTYDVSPVVIQESLKVQYPVDQSKSTAVYRCDDHAQNEGQHHDDTGFLDKILTGYPVDLLPLTLYALHKAGLLLFFCLCVILCHRNYLIIFRLLCFFVKRMFAAELAVFLSLHSFRMFFLILHGIVIALLAFCTR